MKMLIPTPNSSDSEETTLIFFQMIHRKREIPMVMV